MYALKTAHIQAINLRCVKVSQPDPFILFAKTEQVSIQSKHNLNYKQSTATCFGLFTYIPCSILILSKFFYPPTDAQLNCLKNNFKIYIKIDIKTALTYFGVVTPSSGSALLVLAKVAVVKIAN
jgi:hypothetical protein